MNRTSYASRKSDNWATPKYIYKQALEKNMFDPCPLHSTIDGLQIDWGKTNFVNPPYSQLRKWVDKSIEQHSKGKAVTLLIPARTDTRAFETLWRYGCEFIFITGRLHFNEAESAPFPSMIVKLNGNKKTTCKIINKEEIDL